MKNKTPLLILSLTLILILSGCGTSENPIETIRFNITFDELNLEDNTAEFVVYGYPNELEFEQISTTIIDSLEAQEVEDTSVSVYSSLQDETTDEPFFGTAKYKDGKLIENNLKQNTEENFMNLVN